MFENNTRNNSINFFIHHCLITITMKTDLEREVRSLIPWFRNIKDWTIIVDNTTNLYDQCEYDVDKKTATIYRRKSDISDRIYAIHEILHIVFIAAFHRTKPYSKQQINKREEDLIEDLCAFLYLNIK